MNPRSLTRQYHLLSPEERFRLILAASGRGDEAERDRLGRSGDSIQLRFPDHAPWSQAFGEISMLHFIELLDQASRYLELFARADQANEDEEVEEEERSADTNVEALPSDQASGDADPDDDRPVGGFNERCFRSALASGYVLRVKAEGWKLFCERLKLPPYLLWEALPGYVRVRAAIDMSQRAAFTEVGFLKWLNERRKPGEAALTRSPLTVELVAQANQDVYRERSRWWGG